MVLVVGIKGCKWSFGGSLFKKCWSCFDMAVIVILMRGRGGAERGGAGRSGVVGKFSK